MQWQVGICSLVAMFNHNNIIDTLLISVFSLLVEAITSKGSKEEESPQR